MTAILVIKVKIVLLVVQVSTSEFSMNQGVYPSLGTLNPTLQLLVNVQPTVLVAFQPLIVQYVSPDKHPILIVTFALPHAPMTATLAVLMVVV